MIKRLRFPCGLEFENVSFVKDNDLNGLELKHFICPMHKEKCGENSLLRPYFAFDDEKVKKRNRR